LFPELDAKLIELLKGLSAEDWQKPTICVGWNVKDVAAHLLDGNLRRLSVGRDQYFGENPDQIGSYQDLVSFLNRLNADWVKAMKRISPHILIAFLEQTGKEIFEFFSGLNPHEKAIFPVAWAGETESENWFDIAREYTERWHHQQQIRLAANKPGISSRKLYFPVLETFMRALPFNFRNVEADEGTRLKFHISGDAGSDWFLQREAQNWLLCKDLDGEFASETIIPQEIAWRLFTKGIDPETAKSQIIIKGREKLGNNILKMLAVMA
jgi:uncharacterized protein (TIGR03083 family)